MKFYVRKVVLMVKELNLKLPFYIEVTPRRQMRTKSPLGRYY